MDQLETDAEQSLSSLPRVEEQVREEPKEKTRGLGKTGPILASALGRVWLGSLSSLWPLG